ncbi:hypothetical protein O181_040342 [Austropuccinia psidii MF-1]|uniref:Uncharacterized protein n=1 Tax=Austropuccinia psidii MF-1 TaxID=1389203 RepID=A0A9Q3DIL3_9BASI|nr:hypothetical protein [Austropuccinia psidii MF-1]
MVNTSDLGGKKKLFPNEKMTPGDLKLEHSSEEAIFYIERNRHMSWFIKQKDRLTTLHPDIFETMVHERILRNCGGDIEPFSTEDYINSMEEITTRTKIDRNWYKPPIDNQPS